MFIESFCQELGNINHQKTMLQKMPLPHLDASFRELSNGGLGSFVALSVCWQIDSYAAAHDSRSSCRCRSDLGIGEP